MNCAVIVAAGRGNRFGSQIPKQFVEIGGKPVLIHTLERFENCAAIDEIILVLAAAEIEGFRRLLQKFDFSKLKKICAGGDTRAASVFEGVKNASAQTQIFVIHDGARPFVKDSEITQTIEKAKEKGASCLTAEVTDTIKEVDEKGSIIRTISRESLRRALTPQCFRADILRKAFASVENLSATATDECYLVENAGFQVAAVKGSAQNIKITFPEDLAFAEYLLNRSADFSSDAPNNF